jgi:2-methylcitrate dehydratase PrpD
MDVIAGQPNDDLTSTVTVALKDGRSVTRTAKEFSGTPARPLNEAGLREKFTLLTKRFPQPAMDRIFTRLQTVENEKDLSWLAV